MARKTGKRRIPGLRLASVLVAAGMSAPVMAQQVPATEKIEKIEITGTNIKRVDSETPSVVQIITKDDILISGASTVAEVLRALPALGANALTDYNTGTAFSPSVQSASLRGLGAVGTLVLLNGRRVAPSPTADPNTGQGQAFNLNTIPFSAIERIELLKDGASAIYGSDAIAGVVNVILKKDYQGAEVSVNGGANAYNQFKNYTVNAIGGFGSLAKDRFNVLLSGEYFHRDAVDYNHAAGVQNDAYARLTGRNTPISTLTNPPNYFRERTLGNGLFNVALPTDPRCPPALVVSASSGCRTNTFDYLQIQGEAERYGFTGKGTLAFTPTLQGTTEVSFTRAINHFTNVPPSLNGTSTAQSWFNAAGERRSYLLTLPVGHPDNPYTFPVGLRYRFTDLGTPQYEITNDAVRILAALSGTHLGWDWESALLYNKTSLTNVNDTALYFPAVQSAVANRTYRFGGSNDPALLASLHPKTRSKGETDVSSLDVKGSRELFYLPAGPVVIALGAEARRETFDITSDPRVVAGDFMLIASTTVDGSRNVASIFSEISAPLAKNLELQLAGRTDHYSDYGNSTTPKVGFKWKVFEHLALRANYAEAFRAPSLTQRSNSRVQSFSTVTDPVRCPNGVPLPGADPEDCSGRTVSSLFLPSADLQPERSKSFTVGGIFAPSANTAIQADLWEIRRRDTIDRFSAQQVINAEFTPGFTGGSVVRDTNPAAQLPGVPNSGPLQSTLRRFLNLGETRVKGVDVEASTGFALGGGRAKLSTLATWTIRHDIQFNKGDPYVNNAGNFYFFEVPKLRGNITAEYAKSDWRAFSRLNYIGGWSYNDPTVSSGCYLSPASATLAFLGRCQVAAQKTLDLGGSYQGFKNLMLSMVIRNIEGKRAPYDPGPNSTTSGFNPSFHSPVGANASVTATYRFR